MLGVLSFFLKCSDVTAEHLVLLEEKRILLRAWINNCSNTTCDLCFDSLLRLDMKVREANHTD